MSSNSFALFAIPSTTLMVALVLCPARSPAQDSAPTKQRQRQSATRAVSLAESLRDVQARAQQLNVMLGAMSDEVARSRDEVKRLRKEIQETRSELTALKSSPLDSASGTNATRRARLSSSGGEDIAEPYNGGLARTSHIRPVKTADARLAGGAAGRDNTHFVAGGGELLAEGDNLGLAEGNKERFAENAATTNSERLAKLEEAQQLLSGKVDEQYQTKVESASKYRVRLSGIALLNVFSNQGSVDIMDLPTVALNRRPLDVGGSFGATVRQSMMGLEVFGPTFANARTSAEIHADFFGGAPITPDGFVAGLVRLRSATVRLDWTRTSIVAGQDGPFFSPLSPTSFAALGLPAFSYSGNLWTWTPQVRVEHRVDMGGESSVLIQGGILDPLSGEVPVAQFYRYPDAGERSRQPAYATRLSWTHGVGPRAFTFGTGAYYARQNWGYNRTVNAWATTLDWSLPLAHRLSLTGEFYRGKALGGLGGGTGRSILFSTPANDQSTYVLGLNTVGGWAQLKYRATDKLEFNGAFGDDSPFVSDLRHFPASRSYIHSSVSRNQSAFVNFVYRARSNLLFSAEYRRLSTSQLDKGKLKAGQLNLGVGVLY